MNVTKYMVIVETKNYPINIIRPSIQRYARIRKRMNASEIASCLACHALVTLEKQNGVKVKLTADNFKSVLIGYSNELATIEANKAIRAQQKIDTANLENLREEYPKKDATTTEPAFTTTAINNKKEIVEEQTNEILQDDPEDENTFDSSPFYETDDED